MKSFSKALRAVVAAGAFASITATSAFSQNAPDFFAETYPPHALAAAMQWYGTLGGEGAQLDARTRELVMLGVAAQIPCEYCIYAHTRNALAAGATETQIREAIAAGAAVRMWSTVLHGMQYDYDAFVAEIDQMHGD